MSKTEQNYQSARESYILAITELLIEALQTKVHIHLNESQAEKLADFVGSELVKP